jgi:II/X family phage/plasmid replication protein
VIDWVTGTFNCDHDPEKLNNGRVFSMNPDGEIEWHCEKVLNVEGSYSSNIQIKSASDRTIWFSGNPVKFLQGHNIFGTDDIVYLLGRFFDALLKIDSLGLKPTADQYERVKDGIVHLTRVDINQSWLLNSKSDVLSWIRAAGNCARLKHRGAGQFSGDTLYFGKNSRRWSVKCYSKGHELTVKGRALHADLSHPFLVDYAEKALRLELVMRGMHLKDCMLNVACNWLPETAKMLLCSTVLDNLEITDNMPIPDEILAALPTRMKGIYALWRNGDDLRSSMSKTAFYRWRTQMLAYGVDISMIQESEPKSNVIPLIRYLEAIPAGVPDWAYELGLVA